MLVGLNETEMRGTAAHLHAKEIMRNGF